MMDYEKLIRRLRNDADAYRNGKTLGRAFADQEDVLDNAATALSTLQAENEKRQDELEQVKREKDALIGDFVDYVTDGVPNPAIFCRNRCDKCTDMRGWCTGKNCSGFYPSGARGQKED